MATIAVATVRTPWDCRWSRPGYRLTGVREPFQPETVWVCIRDGERRPVAEVTCEACAFFEEDPTKEN
jgi:hypothetical protein